MRTFPSFPCPERSRRNTTRASRSSSTFAGWSRRNRREVHACYRAVRDTVSYRFGERRSASCDRDRRPSARREPSDSDSALSARRDLVLRTPRSTRAVPRLRTPPSPPYLPNYERQRHGHPRHLDAYTFRWELLSRGTAAFRMVAGGLGNGAGNTASYEARKSGALRHAVAGTRLCPQARSSNRTGLLRAHRAFMPYGELLSPLEPARRRRGHAMCAARSTERQTEESSARLNPSATRSASRPDRVSVNKLSRRCERRGSPRMVVVPDGTEAEFFDPRPIQNCNGGPQDGRSPRSVGIHNIGASRKAAAGVVAKFGRRRGPPRPRPRHLEATVVSSGGAKFIARTLLDNDEPDATGSGWTSSQAERISKELRRPRKPRGTSLAVALQQFGRFSLRSPARCGGPGPRHLRGGEGAFRAHVGRNDGGPRAAIGLGVHNMRARAAVTLGETLEADASRTRRNAAERFGDETLLRRTRSRATPTITAAGITSPVRAQKPRQPRSGGAWYEPEKVRTDETETQRAQRNSRTLERGSRVERRTVRPLCRLRSHTAMS